MTNLEKQIEENVKAQAKFLAGINLSKEIPDHDCHLVGGGGESGCQVCDAILLENRDSFDDPDL